MRVASLVNTHSSSESSRSPSSSPEASSSFQKVLGDVSGSSSKSGTAEDASSSERQASSLAASKRAALVQQNVKANTQAEGSGKKNTAAGMQAKSGGDASTGTSSTQADAFTQVLLVPPQAPVVVGVLPLPVPDAQNSMVAAAGAEAPASTIATSSIPDASANEAPSGTGVTALLANSGLSAASANSALPASEDDDVPVTTASTFLAIPAGSAVATPSTASGASPAPALSDGNAPSLTAEGSAASTPGTPALGPAEALPPVVPEVTPPVAAGSQQSAGGEGAGSASAAISSAGGLARAGAANARSTVVAVQQGRSTKASSVADHEDKHKAASSGTAGADNGDGNSTPFPVTASSSSPEDNRPDSQKAPAMDPAMVQGADAVAVQSSSVTPDSSLASAGSQNAGSTAAANQSPAAVSGSVPETGSMPTVNSAQLIQSVRHSEMRLGIQSDEFGSLSISTSLGRQALSAQISTEHLELGRALAAHLPAMEQKLSTAYGLPAKVELNSGASSSDTTSGQPSQGGRQQGDGSSANSLSTGIAAPITTTNYPVDAAVAGSSRLDVRV